MSGVNVTLRQPRARAKSLGLRIGRFGVSDLGVSRRFAPRRGVAPPSDACGNPAFRASSASGLVGVNAIR